MADIHLNTTGSNTAPYDTWAKAATSWATAVSGMTAGDRLLVDSVFNTASAGVTLTFPGTRANPNQVLSGTPAVTNGISALTAGAQCLSSAATYVVTGSFYSYGVTWKATASSGTAQTFASTDTNTQEFEMCAIENSGTSSGTTFQLGSIASSSGSHVILRDCTLKFGAAGQGIQAAGKVELIGCSVAAGGTSPTSIFLFTGVNGGSRGVDLSVIAFNAANCSAGVNLLGPFSTGGQCALISDVKLPTSWSGVTQTGTVITGCRAEFYALDNGATSHKFSVIDSLGTASQDATIYVTGTTTDGVAVSDKLVTTANVKFPLHFVSRWYYAYDAGAGSAKTATIQVARDGSATKYNDDEAWVEVECLGTSGFPLGVFSNDRAADVLATPAAQATGVGTGSWTGLSGTSCSMALAASYTPRNAGYVRARVCLAKPSATLYVDPCVVLT